MIRYSVFVTLAVMMAVLVGCDDSSTFTAPAPEPAPDPTTNVDGQFSGDWTVVFNVGDQNGLVECSGEVNLERNGNDVSGQTTREDGPDDNCTAFNGRLTGQLDGEATLQLDFSNQTAAQVYHGMTPCEYQSGNAQLTGQVRGDQLELTTSGVVVCEQEEFEVDLEFSGTR